MGMNRAGMTGAGFNLLRTAFIAGTGKTAWDLVSRSLSFAMSVLVARELGAAGYGSFAVYWYITWMLSQATDLGLHLVSLRSLAKECRPSVFWSAVVAKAVLTGAVVIATSAAAAFSPNVTLVLVLLAAQLMGSWVEFFGVVIRSRGFIAREGFLLTTLRLGWLAAASWALSGEGGLTGFALALVLAGTVALGASAALVRHTVDVRTTGPKGDEIVRLFREAFPLALAAAITLLYLRADLLIVAALRDAIETGLFTSAFRLFEATFVISGGIAAGTFPLLAARVGTARFDVLSRFLLVYLAALGGLAGTIFVVAGKPIVTLLFGEDFELAATPLAFLGLGLVPVFANALTTHLLVASGRTTKLVTALGVRLAVGVGVDLALVPSFGAVGAAIAVAVAEWCLLAVSLHGVVDLLGRSASPGRVSQEQATC